MNIKILIPIISLLLVSCGKKQSQENKGLLVKSSIVGGRKVFPSNFKSVVGLADSNGKIFCSGNLINKNQITTASHCILKIDDSPISKLTIKKLIEKRTEYKVNEALLAGKILRQDLKNIHKSVNILKPILKESISELLQLIAKRKINIHVGTGQNNKENKANLDLAKVASVIIPLDYQQQIFNMLYKNTPFYNPIEDFTDANITPDQALITLDRSITTVKPIPFLNEDEARTLLIDGESEITLVGFGRKISQRVLNMNKAAQAFIEDNLNNNTLNSEQKKILNSNYKIINERVAQDKKRSETNGVKGITSLKLHSFEEFIILESVKQEEAFTIFNPAQKSYKTKPTQQQVTQSFFEYVISKKLKVNSDKDFKGACFGDSGGPAFAQLDNGEFRQIGIMVAVDECGIHTFIAPVKL